MSDAQAAISRSRSSRLEGWEIRLDRYLRESAEKPFAWGEHDCCLFVCNAIREMTGKDPAAEFRGRYKTRAGAYALLRRQTGPSGDGCVQPTQKFDFVEAITVICEICGFPPVPVPLAQRGDVVIFADSEGTPALGIVALDGRTVLGLAINGLRRLAIDSALQAWRV